MNRPVRMGRNREKNQSEEEELFIRRFVDNSAPEFIWFPVSIIQVSNRMDHLPGRRRSNLHLARLHCVLPLSRLTHRFLVRQVLRGLAHLTLHVRTIRVLQPNKLRRILSRQEAAFRRVRTGKNFLRLFMKDDRN